jgi:hypothetical protein
MKPRKRVVIGLLSTALVALALPAIARPQGGHEHGARGRHAGGRVTAIAGSTITVARRDGSTRDIYVTDATTYAFEHHPATLADFAAGDFVGAEGETDASGRFVAEHVFGGEEPPPPPGHHFPPDDADLVGGEVVSVDTTARTITVSHRDDETDVIHTTDATSFERNRAAASLGDFKAGDRAMAHGERDASGQFVADRVRGGDRRPDREP